MKYFTTLLIAISISLLNFAQTNKALYTLENVNPVCIDGADDILYGISRQENSWKINSYKLKDGTTIKKFSSILPENPVQSMVQDNKSGEIYLITAKKVDDSQNQFMDAIYLFNPKKDKIKFLYKVKYDYPTPSKLGIVDNKIIFTINNQPTRAYDIKLKDLDVLNRNTDYQLLNIAPEQKGYLMLNIRNIEGDKIPVYFMDSDNNFGDKIGYYHPNITIKSSNKSFQIPTITLEDESFNWIIKPIRYNCFPLQSFQITMRPFWLKQAYYLDKVETITALVASNNNYLLARENNNTIVYKLMTEANLNESSFSEDEIANLEEYLSKTTYTRELIDNDLLENVFDAVFYKVFRQNKFKYIAILTHGNYIKLDSYEQPISLFDKNFKLLNEQNAKDLQEALNIILPPDDFNLKHLKYYKKENQWVFIRGIAFEKYIGYEFSINEDGSIKSIKYNPDL